MMNKVLFYTLSHDLAPRIIHGLHAPASILEPSSARIPILFFLFAPEREALDGMALADIHVEPSKYGHEHRAYAKDDVTGCLRTAYIDIGQYHDEFDNEADNKHSAPSPGHDAHVCAETSEIGIGPVELFFPCPMVVVGDTLTVLFFELCVLAAGHNLIHDLKDKRA